MNFLKRDCLEELLEECGFWGRYTKDLKKESDSLLLALKWFFLALGKFLYLFICYPKSWQISEKQRIDLLTIFLTKNQKRAIDSWLSYKKSYKSLSNYFDSDFRLPWGRFHFFCLIKLFPTFCRLCLYSGAKTYLPWLEDFVRYEAGKVIAREIFFYFETKVVLISNDHSGEARAIMRVAREKGIKTVYTQHACIGFGFPPLRFDLSMLDGIIALKKYVKSGKVRGLVALTGRQKVLKNRENKRIFSKRAGLATNILDALDYCEALLQELSVANWAVVLRCHPADRRIRHWRYLARKYNAIFDEGPLEGFLDNIDVLITGQSGITLDAYIRGVPSVVYFSKDFSSNEMIDYYDFFSSGLSQKLDVIKNLNQKLLNAIAQGTNLKIAAQFDAGVIFDPVVQKNKIMDAFIDGYVSGLSTRENDMIRFCKSISLYGSSGYLESICCDGSGFEC